MGSHPWIRNYKPLMRKLAFLGEEPPTLLSNTVFGLENIYTQRAKVDSAGCIYIFLYMGCGGLGKGWEEETDG